MAAYLPDTNHDGALVVRTHPVRQRVLAARAVGDTFGLTIPVITETVYGIIRSANSFPLAARKTVPQR